MTFPGGFILVVLALCFQIWPVSCLAKDASTAESKQQAQKELDRPVPLPAITKLYSGTST